MPCSQTHTALHTARKKNAANPSQAYCTEKKYNMPHPIFAAILLLSPTHAQESNWDLQNLTKGKTAIAIFPFVAHPPP